MKQDFEQTFHSALNVYIFSILLYPRLYVVFIRISPLHEPVTWYRINYPGTQLTQQDLKNKGTLTSPLRYLRLSIIYSVPCDRVMQRAYYKYSSFFSFSDLRPQVYRLQAFIATDYNIVVILGTYRAPLDFLCLNKVLNIPLHDQSFSILPGCFFYNSMPSFVLSLSSLSSLSGF